MVQSPKNDFIPLLYQRVGLFKNCCWCEWMIQSRSKDHGSESLHTFRVSSDVDSVWLVTLSFYLVDLKLLWTWYSKVGLWDETIRYYCCSRQDKCYFLRFRQKWNHLLFEMSPRSITACISPSVNSWPAAASLARSLSMYMEGADERVVGYHTKKHTLKKKKSIGGWLNRWN